MEKEADIRAKLKQLELMCDENYEHNIDNRQKWMLAKPILEKASNNNLTVAIAVVITIINLLLLFLR